MNVNVINQSNQATQNLNKYKHSQSNSFNSSTNVQLHIMKHCFELSFIKQVFTGRVCKPVLVCED